MRLIVDAQLPRRLCSLLRSFNHHAVHTLDLPDGNRTTDAQISALSIAEHRIVVTKDSGFRPLFARPEHTLQTPPHLNW